MQAQSGLAQSGLAPDSSLGARIRFLLRDTAFYGVVGALARFASIFTLPVLTRVLSAAEFGLMDGIIIFAGVFVPLLILGQDSAVALYFHETEEMERRRQVVSTGLLLQLLLAVVLAVALFLIASPFMHLALGIPAAGSMFRIAVAALPFVIVVRFATNLAKYTFQRRRYLVLTVGLAVATVSLTVLFVLGLRWGVPGVFWASFLAHAAFALLGLWYCREYLRPALTPELVSKLLGVGIPFMIVGVASVLLPSVDRYFIANLLSLEELGVYAVGLRIAGLLSLVVGAFQIAWGPFAFAIYRQPGANETFARVLTYFTFAGMAAALALVALGPALIYVIASERYLAGSYLVAPLAVAILLGGIYYFPVLGVTFAKRAYWNPIAFFAGVLAAVGLNYLLVPRIGLLGAALGVVGGQIVAIAVVGWGTQRVYPIPFPYLRCAALLAAGGAVAWAMEWIEVGSPLLAALVRLLLLLLYLLLGVHWVLERGERKRLAELGWLYLSRLARARAA